jgi:hypothetical protein
VRWEVLMLLTHDERVLHGMAIERIRAGELPDHAPKQVWGGNGGGGPCALCGKRIRRSELEYELLDGADRVFLFHLRCHTIWQLALSAQPLSPHLSQAD